ncbi:MAG: hypothetical protein ACPGYX_07780 [Oceanobacter sp.]
MEPTQLIVLALPILILLGIVVVIWLIKRSITEATDLISDQMMSQLEAARQINENQGSKLSLFVERQIEDASLHLAELSQTLSDTREQLESLSTQFDGAQEKQQLVNSEVSAGFTLLEDNLSGKLNTLKQQLLNSLQAEVETEDSVIALQTHIEAMGQGIRKLAEAQQKLTHGMSSNFAEVIKETATLKKAASAQLARLKAIEENASNGVDFSETLAPVTNAVEQNYAMIQAALDQISALSLMLAESRSDDSEADAKAFESQQALLDQLETLIRNNSAAVTEALHGQSGLLAELESISKTALALTENMHSSQDSSGQLLEQLESVIGNNSATVIEALSGQSDQLTELASISKTALALTENMHTGQLEVRVFEQAVENLSEQTRSIRETVRAMLSDLKENSLSLVEQEQASEDASQSLSQEIESSSEALMAAIHAQKTEMRDRIEEVSMFFADELTDLQNAQKQAEKQQQQLLDLMILLRGQRLASLPIAEQVDSAQVASGDATEEKIRIETKDFVQYLSHARIERIEDKSTGEVTLFEYKDGLKSASETYINDALKFRWLFNRHGQITQSKEYDDQGFEIEECDYNSQGEVVARRSSKSDSEAETSHSDSGLTFP